MVTHGGAVETRVTRFSLRVMSHFFAYTAGRGHATASVMMGSSGDHAWVCSNLPTSMAPGWHLEMAPRAPRLPRARRSDPQLWGGHHDPRARSSDPCNVVAVIEGAAFSHQDRIEPIRANFGGKLQLGRFGTWHVDHATDP